MTGRAVLMAIHPQHAEAILDGRKTVEFRKRPLAEGVETVTLYATAPISAVVGEFTVWRCLVASPARLWAAVRAMDCGANGASFRAYFAGRTMAVGIFVSEPVRYARPVELSELPTRCTRPRSVVALSDNQLAALRALSEHEEKARPLGVE